MCDISYGLVFRFVNSTVFFGLKKLTFFIVVSTRKQIILNSLTVFLCTFIDRHQLEDCGQQTLEKLEHIWW